MGNHKLAYWLKAEGDVRAENRGGKFMGGVIVFIAGIGMVALAVILFAACIAYRKTEGKKIREELQHEYEP